MEIDEPFKLAVFKVAVKYVYLNSTKFILSVLGEYSSLLRLVSFPLFKLISAKQKDTTFHRLNEAEPD